MEVPGTVHKCAGIKLTYFKEPRNRFRQAGNRILGSLKGLQIRAQITNFAKNSYIKLLILQIKILQCKVFPWQLSPLPATFERFLASYSVGDSDPDPE